MIITISGTAGSGKSSVGKKLAEKLNYKHYSNGDFMREIATKRGVTILELNKLSESDASVDKELDDRQIKLGKEEDNFIIDSRLGFHFIPNSVKIFLDADIDDRAKRVFNQKRKGIEDNESLEDTKQKIQDRLESEKKRYKELYKVDYLDLVHYDLLVDTTGVSVEEVVDEVREYLKSL